MRVLQPVGLEVRAYQKNIAESALDANTLVVIPTGLGKTVIALLTAVDRLSAFPDAKVVFLAPTRPLVAQHAQFFRDHLTENDTPVETEMLTGEVSPETRSTTFQKAKLIFATPEVIRNDVVVEHRYSLRDVCILVFDEAHRCVKDYAYSEVAEAYKHEASHPLILGLTASPSSRRERINEICTKLAITNVEARTETDADVTGYVKAVTIAWERVPLPKSYITIGQLLRNIFDEKVRKLCSMHYLPNNVMISKRILLELGESLHRRLAKARVGFLFAAVILQSQALSVQHAIELLETQGIDSMTKYLSRLQESKNKSARSLAKDPRIVEALKLSQINPSEHPKRARLRQLITDQLKEKKTAKLIVFTQFRTTVESIVENLNTLEDVSAMRFVGQATRNEKDVGLTQSEQIQILKDFAAGKFNVLVTTSIGEEGLHVPDVDHVVFYEAIPSEIRSIQRRGRTGRTMIGKVTILMAEDTVDEAYYWTSQRKEKQMQHFIENVKKKGYTPPKQKTTLLDFT